MADKCDVDTGVKDLGTDMLEGKGGGRIISDGAIVCGRLLAGKSCSVELSVGRGSLSSCIGESNVDDEIYFGVGGSAELVVSDM